MADKYDRDTIVQTFELMRELEREAEYAAKLATGSDRAYAEFVGGGFSVSVDWAGDHYESCIFIPDYWFFKGLEEQAQTYRDISLRKESELEKRIQAQREEQERARYELLRAKFEGGE